MKSFTIFLLLSAASLRLIAQDIVPFDTAKWNITAQSYILENYRGKDAIYLQNGSAILKNTSFLNGTIEFDIFLTERQAFPGVYFRIVDNLNSEQFYVRPHQSGNPDANQAVSIINGLAAWQLYFGETYSFPYRYNFDDWTHIKLVVNGEKAQVFLDYSEEPHLSWILKHPPREGSIGIGGGFAPMHFANFKFDPEATELINFKEIPKPPVEGAIRQWQVSDAFKEDLLDDPKAFDDLISKRKWLKTMEVDETSAVNLSWLHSVRGTDANTVMVKLDINSTTEQVKQFEFGYSDRVVVILNGKAIYRGDNGYRTRDYRYLGTIGLFDAVYLNLKRGANELIFAVSEDFGGWGIIGRFKDQSGIKVNP